MTRLSESTLPRRSTAVIAGCSHGPWPSYAKPCGEQHGSRAPVLADLPALQHDRPRRSARRSRHGHFDSVRAPSEKRAGRAKIVSATTGARSDQTGTRRPPPFSYTAAAYRSRMPQRPSQIIRSANVPRRVRPGSFCEVNPLASGELTGRRWRPLGRTGPRASRAAPPTSSPDQYDASADAVSLS